MSIQPIQEDEMARRRINPNPSDIDETMNQANPDPEPPESLEQLESPKLPDSSVNTNRVDAVNTVEDKITEKVPEKTIAKPKKNIEVVKINVVTFCRTKNYSCGIQSRLGIFLQEHGDQEQIKTLDEWEQIYKSAMKRITK